MQENKRSRLGTATHVRTALLALGGAILVAMIMSASASAAWINSSTGATLLEEISPRTLKGEITFDAAGAPIECSTSGSLELEPNLVETRASIPGLTNECEMNKAYGEALGCNVESTETTTPIEVKSKGSELQFDDLTVDANMNTGCLFGKTIKMECKPTGASPNSPEEIGTLHLWGGTSCTAEFTPEEGSPESAEASLEGDLSVSPAEYGFGSSTEPWGEEGGALMLRYGEPISSIPDTETYTGHLSFEDAYGPIRCDASMTARLLYWTAQVSSFELTSCEVGSYLNQYECSPATGSAVVEGGPWALKYVDGGALEIEEGVTADLPMTGNCLWSEDYGLFSNDTIQLNVAHEWGDPDELEINMESHGWAGWNVEGTLSAAEPEVHTLYES